MLPGFRHVDEGTYCSDHLVQRDLLFLYRFTFPSDEEVEGFLKSNIEEMDLLTYPLSRGQKKSVRLSSLKDIIPPAEAFQMYAGEPYMMAAYHSSQRAISSHDTNILSWKLALSTLEPALESKDFDWHFVQPVNSPKDGWVVGNPDDLTMRVYSLVTPDMCADFDDTVKRFLGLCTLYLKTGEGIEEVMLR